MNNNKSKDAYKTIGEVTKELDLVDKKTGHLQTHTIRYWETQFKQIKPSIRAGKRRYYSIAHGRSRLPQHREGELSYSA